MAPGPTRRLTAPHGPTRPLPPQVFRKGWAGTTCTNAAFKTLLSSMYDVFVLLHGRMGTLLEQVREMSPLSPLGRDRV